MIVGLVWPTPGPTADIDPHLLSLARTGTGATHLRFNLDYRHPEPYRLIRLVREGGFEPLPIIDFTYDHTNDVDMARFIAFSQMVIEDGQLDQVELLNEPRVIGGWSGAQYGKFLAPVCEAIRGTAWILVAGDYLQPDRKGPKMFPRWFDDVRAEVDDDAYDTVAWHTYREPASPDTTRYKDRHDEYHSMRRPLPHEIPVQVTEVGWNLHGVSPELQASYLAQELDINLTLGIEATYIYAAIPGSPDLDFGLFNHDWTPRASAQAVLHFQTKRVDV